MDTTVLEVTHDYIEDIKKGKIDRSNFNANLQFLLNPAAINKNMRILEVGCGAGRLTDYLTQIEYNIIGFDVSKNLIVEGSKRYKNLRVLLASGEDIPFKSATFDAVISFDVFEHILDSEQHLSEIRRVLRPKGLFLFQTPNKLTNLPFEIIKNKSLTRHRNYHRSLQTYWSLQSLLANSGFAPIFIKTPVMNDFFESKIKRVFGNVGVLLLRLVNPDKLPIPLRTNFYVWGAKV